MNNIKNLSFLLFLFIGFTGYSQSTILGSVTDSKGNSLPYTNVYWKKALEGTLSNLEGNFKLSSSTKNKDTLCVELLGFEVKYLPAAQITSPLKVALNPKAFELKELVVKPQPPTYYIKQAVKETPKNLDTNAFSQKSYYREIIKENGAVNRMAEAILLSKNFNGVSTKTDSIHISIKHGRKASDQETIAFMQGYVEKQREKEVKKLKRKGEEIPEELKEEGGAQIDLGGPKYLLMRNFLLEPSEFLDSTQFKYYDYMFDEYITYKGRPTTVIKFTQKDNVRKPLFDGKVYIDDWDKAFSVLEFELSEKGKKHIIPAYYKPLMWAFGIGVEAPDIKIQVFGKKVGRYWHVDYFHLEGGFTATKSHWFKDDEVSTFQVDQLLKVQSFDENIENQLFNFPKLNKGSLFDQIENTYDPFWENFKL